MFHNEIWSNIFQNIRRWWELISLQYILTRFDGKRKSNSGRLLNDDQFTSWIDSDAKVSKSRKHE